MSDLSAAFSALTPTAKAMFLARVAHMATVAARSAYAPDMNYPGRDFDHPDGVVLRDTNHFVHRVTGYIMHVLDCTEREGQDASMMAMIVGHFQTHQLEEYLTKWLGISN
jgi:hypothetical protein